jgi:carbon monoxide dehydrogenase subunit G
MEMSGEYRIVASIGDVWAALNDVEVLRICIPGCEELEQISDTELTAKVALKIGPVKARFNGVVNFENVDAPNGYSIIGEGQGGIAGFAKGGADVKLTEDDGETILTYQAQAQVGGKIAQLGSRLVKSTAAKLADKFFKNFHDVLLGAETAA